MDKQNVTLALPKDLLQRAKSVAVNKRMSLSGLLIDLLQDLVDSEEEYAHARDRQLAILERGYRLGTGGSIGWSRDELHDR
jgi:tryptophan 2,3-dioxygenase